MRALLRLLALPFLFLLATTYPRSDRWGRPQILDPATGKRRSHTRVTTVAKALDDMNGIMGWREVMVAGGAALRPDILAKVSARWPRTPDNKGELNKLAEELREAAAASAGANLGDALHTLIARRNVGEVFRALPPLDTDLKAYEELLELAGLEVLPEYVERTVVIPGMVEEVAGSFDLLARKAARPELLPLITDLKTGQSLELQWPSIAVQLALYSRARSIYDWDTETHLPMPEVDQRHGLVVSLPAGSATAELYVVDLDAGWAAAQVALWVRAWRKRRDFVRPARY